MANEGNGTNLTEDAFVDILDSSRNRDFKFEAKQEDDPYATENSSSFADSTSENQSSSMESGTEVESQFLSDGEFSPSLDGLGSIFRVRKKKPSAQWRNFIKPLTWRCKWTELRIKELEWRASKYAKEIDAVDDVALDQTQVELSGSKSLIFPGPRFKNKPMKRVKRKRIEDTADIPSYMSNHTIFSLYQNKRCGHDVNPRWEDLGKQGNDEFPIHDDPEILLENDDDSIEELLRKITTLDTNIDKMKAQIDSLMMENFDKFSSSENLSGLVPLQETSSASACNGETTSLQGMYPSPPHDITDYGFGEFMMMDDGFGEAIDIPDIIESNVGLLSSVDVPRDSAQVGDSSEKIVDNILIENEADAEQSNPSSSSCLVASSELRFPKNKRKRGERKACSSNWSRQKPTSEP